MPQNFSPPQKKNRMTQEEMVVKVWINMKSFYDFVFQYCVFFSVWYKNWETQKKPEICQTPKIAKILQNPEK